VPINLAQAALGASIDILTFDGCRASRFPKVSSRQPASAEGLGVPHLSSSGRGDLYVIWIASAGQLTREQRKLLEAACGVLPVENEPQEKGFSIGKDYFHVATR